MLCLEDLPVELLYSTVFNNFAGVFNHLNAQDLKSIRYVCRRWRDVSAPLFRSTFFAELSGSLDAIGLSTLADICANKPIARAVRTVQIIFDSKRSYHALFTACLDKLPNCTTLAQALEPLKKKASRLQWIKILDNTQKQEHEEHDIAVRQLWTMLEGAALSKTRIKHLIVDGRNHVRGEAKALWVPHCSTQDVYYMKCDADSPVPVESVTMCIDPQAHRVAATYDQQTFDCRPLFQIFSPALTKIDITIGATNNHAEVLAAQAIMKALVQLRKLSHVSIVFRTGIRLGVAPLRELIKNSPGSLVKVKIFNMGFCMNEITDLISVLREMSMHNRALEAVDLGQYHLQHSIGSHIVSTFTIRLEDSRPHAFGALLMQEQITRLQKWMELMGLA